MRSRSLAAADRWLRDYGKAWEQASPQLASALFTEDCRYYETPFVEPAIGRDGVFVLEFDEAGLCRSLREWWHREETAPA